MNNNTHPVSFSARFTGQKNPVTPDLYTLSPALVSARKRILILLLVLVIYERIWWMIPARKMVSMFQYATMAW